LFKDKITAMADKAEGQGWWQKPQLRKDEEEGRERRVTWLELFYDLVFVVVVAELAHVLAAHVSVEGVVGYVLLFIPARWLSGSAARFTTTVFNPKTSAIASSRSRR
jgi:low temperature requirement protein LtrA